VGGNPNARPLQQAERNPGSRGVLVSPGFTSVGGPGAVQSSSGNKGRKRGFGAKEGKFKVTRKENRKTHLVLQKKKNNQNGTYRYWTHKQGKRKQHKKNSGRGLFGKRGGGEGRTETLQQGSRKKRDD